STISGNTATFSGGGIRSVNGALTLINSAVAANQGAEYGGGGEIDFTSPSLVTINNSSITENTARIAGGGDGAEVSSATFNDSTVSGNGAPVGGGLSDVGSSVTLHNTLVSDNTARLISPLPGNGGGNGGGIYDQHYLVNGECHLGTLVLNGSS